MFSIILKSDSNLKMSNKAENETNSHLKEITLAIMFNSPKAVGSMIDIHNNVT